MADGSARGVAKSAGSAAIAGVLLALPFATIFSLLLIGGAPPPLGPLEPFVNSDARPNVLGTAIVVGAWLLALAAFILNVVPVAREARAGRGLATSPANLLVATAALALVLFFIGAIIVDQYPCWIGVPNCD